MRIVICTKNSLLANVAVNALLSRLADQEVSVVLANRVREVADTEPEFRQMRLFDEGIPTQIVFPLLDERSTAGRFASFGQLARRHGCQVITRENVDKEGLTCLLRDLRPDLIISVVFGFLFRRDDIALPRHGIINLHTGPLPEMPGLHAVFWSMAQRRSHATCTAHLVDAGVDSGPIVESRDMPLDYGASLYDNLAACYEVGGSLLGELASCVAAGGVLRGLPQDRAARGKKLLYPGRADLDAFYAAGGTWIDDAAYLERLRRDYLLSPNFLDGRQVLFGAGDQVVA